MAFRYSMVLMFATALSALCEVTPRSRHFARSDVSDLPASLAWIGKAQHLELKNPEFVGRSAASQFARDAPSFDPPGFRPYEHAYGNE
jgi:hypothetical protein